MKKLLIVIACTFLGVQLASAQDFSKGDVVINAGIGFGSTLHTGTGFKTTVPPLSASVEFCIVDNLFDANSSIGVGGVIGYSAQKYEYSYLSYSSETKYSDFLLGARGSFHYQFVDKLDTYAGIVLAYDIVSTKSTYKGSGTNTYKADGSSFFAGAYVGARYYFTDQFAAMAEIGYDIAVFKIGVAIKF